MRCAAAVLLLLAPADECMPRRRAAIVATEELQALNHSWILLPEEPQASSFCSAFM